MDTLPESIEDIIITYKHQIEHCERFSKTLKQIKLHKYKYCQITSFKLCPEEHQPNGSISYHRAYYRQQMRLQLNDRLLYDVYLKRFFDY